MELQNYIYTVTQPNLRDLSPNQPWADLEFTERIYGGGHDNPGHAWKSRADVWRQFLQENGKFSYTYDERMFFQLVPIIKELRENPDSRQLFMGIWDPYTDVNRLGGVARVPCTLGYLFQVREGQLHMTYMMRSSDFSTHFQNDVYLAFMLQMYVASKINIPVGRFTHYMGSLHLFRKDAHGIF